MTGILYKRQDIDIWQDIDIPEQDICDLIGTTKSVIKTIKNKTHKNYADIKPRSPVTLGLCSGSELDFVIAKLSRD